MASEQSFADRAGRGLLLFNTVSGFATAYVSTDPINDLANLETQSNTCAAANAALDTKIEAYNIQAGEREALVKEIKSRCTASKNYVLSVKALKPYWAAVKRAAQLVTTIKPKKVPPGAPAPPKRNKGEQSFADIENNFKALINLYTSIGGSYTPTSPDLTVVNLTAQNTNLHNLTDALSIKGGEISVLIPARKLLFDGDGGLKERMLSVKSVCKSQYGINSPEYNSVKGIRV